MLLGVGKYFRDLILGRKHPELLADILVVLGAGAPGEPVPLGPSKDHVGLTGDLKRAKEALSVQKEKLATLMAKHDELIARIKELTEIHKALIEDLGSLTRSLGRAVQRLNACERHNE